MAIAVIRFAAAVSDVAMNAAMSLNVGNILQ